MAVETGVFSGDDGLDQLLLVIMFMDIPHQGHIELHIMGRGSDQGNQTGIARSEIIEGDFEPLIGIMGHQFFKLHKISK